jgi:uroporphyrinogen-III synthase
MLFKVVCFIVLIAETASFAPIQKRPRKVSPQLNVVSSPVCIALTREDGKNGKLRKELESRLDSGHVKLYEIPCIAHAVGADLDRLGSTLAAGDFDYVAVTSPEAARVLWTAWKDVVTEKKPAVAAVGKATQEALESLGIPVDFTPSKATAKTLVAELPAKRPNGGTTLLYPASTKAAPALQDGLKQRGFDVTRLNTYDTVVATWTPQERELASQVQIVCFGSPSAVTGWLENTQNNSQILAACIGETSAAACRSHGWPESRIFSPEKPGVPGWASAVEEALQSIKVAHP